MLRKLRPHLTYANVVATIALVIAVGGGSAWAVQKVRTRDIAYHAVTASKVNYNAISSWKVENNSLAGKDVRDNSLTSVDVRNGTLRAEDFGADQLPKGEKGDKGDKGDPATSLHGTVSAAGVLSFGSGVTSVVPGDPGEYTVTFARDVSRCSAVATVADADGGSVSATRGAAFPQRIEFRTRNAARVATDIQFGFAVFC
jgi:hypothetical protein